MILILLFIILSIVIDYVSGNKGWALDYLLPLAIIATDIALIVLMIYNRKNWQSYICLQLLMVLCSFIPIALYLLNLEKQMNLAILPMAVSATLFLGTIILGDRRARTELKRRFHVN